MTATWRARCSRGHYLAAKDVHTTLDPEDWDDTCHCKTQPATEPPANTETLGHEPFEYDGAPICTRCYIQHHGWREAIAWPCTSALVLGLVPRTTP